MLGLRFFYALDGESVSTMELNILLRFYLYEKETHTGFFVQLNTGAALCSYDDDKYIGKTEVGALSIGVSAGWRFAYGKKFFYEPAVRVGYPYVIGLGIAAGIRF